MIERKVPTDPQGRPVRSSEPRRSVQPRPVSDEPLTPGLRRASPVDAIGFVTSFPPRPG